MDAKSALIIGASKGLGLAVVKELFSRGWDVTGTARKEDTQLHAFAKLQSERIHVEHLDITKVEEIAVLKSGLENKKFNLVFVNAGTANMGNETIGTISIEEFARVMVTNSLSTMRAVEEFTSNVRAGGIIGVMSSGQGSVADNENGGFEVYRASKAALNTLMRSFAARRAKDCALLLLAPGWIKTDLGGPHATFTMEEVIGDIVDTITAQEGKRGLRYLDRFGKTVRW
jgi:NAD(P)-dependent dehydrogenase (short-subunit alcohol dehydrogenase family)